MEARAMASLNKLIAKYQDDRFRDAIHIYIWQRLHHDAFHKITITVVLM